MPWTTPRDWTAGELVTEAMMDTHVRDNLKMIPHLIVRKTSNESVSSSTVLQNDDHLLFAMATNEVWMLHICLIHSGGASGVPDLKLAFTLPSGATMALESLTTNDSGTAFNARWNTSGSNTNVLSPASANPGTLIIDGIVTNGGTAGNFQTQFAQVNSSAENETLYANSAIFGMLVT